MSSNMTAKQITIAWLHYDESSDIPGKSKAHRKHPPPITPSMTSENSAKEKTHRS